MEEVKVSLSITLPGSVMKSEKECSKNPKESYNHHSVEVYDGKKKKRETIKFITRKCKTARQCIQMPKKAYTYMTSAECPSWAIKKEWNRMNKKARLEAHMKNICEHLGGISYTYEIFED